MISFSGFTYVKPSRWWRRQQTLQFTIWPRFLAQALCPHNRKNSIMWDVENSTKTSLCEDCHKHITEPNDCAHGEVTTHMWESTPGGELAPRSFLCQHCGIELGQKDLPPGTHIIY